jgi:hypothetical protein
MVTPSYAFRLSQHGLDLDPAGHHALSWPSACRAATTANITISTALNNGDSLDGVTLSTGDRVLVKNQATASQNGIYIVGATPARADDYGSSGQIVGSVVIVSEGTAGADTAWQCTTNGPITVGTTALVFTAFGGGATPTLENVLLAGNDTGGNPLISDDVGYLSPNYLDLGTGGNIELYGAAKGPGEWGATIDIRAGDGDNGASGPADVFLEGGHDDGTGGSMYLDSGAAEAGTGTDGGDIRIRPAAGAAGGRHGLIIVTGLPTSDPGVTGALWNNAGTIKISP